MANEIRRQRPVKLTHEPDPEKRQFFAELVHAIHNLQGELLIVTCPGGGNQGRDLPANHTLGRVPDHVRIEMCLPVNRKTPFSAFDVPEKRTKRRIVLRTDSLFAGDKIYVRVR